MKTTKRKAAAGSRRRASVNKISSGFGAARLLRRSFYYLKAEQYLKTYGWFACEAA